MGLLLPHMACRLHACAHALATEIAAYVQHGQHPTNPDDSILISLGDA